MHTGWFGLKQYCSLGICDGHINDDKVDHKRQRHITLDNDDDQLTRARIIWMIIMIFDWSVSNLPSTIKPSTSRPLVLLQPLRLPRSALVKVRTHSWTIKLWPESHYLQPVLNISGVEEAAVMILLEQSGHLRIQQVLQNVKMSKKKACLLCFTWTLFW